MPGYLIVIYGTSSINNEAAWHLAQRLPGKSAVLSLDQLIGGAIAQPSEDVSAELDMAHTQLRLLVANYMRNGYHVVVEGAFFYDRGGQVLRYEQDIDQLVALMRNMTRRALTVHLVSENEGFGYRPRDSASALRLDSSCNPEEITSTVLDRLLVEGSI